MKKFFKKASVSLLLAMLISTAFLSATAKSKPNIIFILTDDLGYGDVGFNWPNCQGKIATPNIDKLALSGVRLTSHYAAAPVCAPSRASLLTGKVQGECSLRDNCFDRPFAEKDTLGSVLKASGYATWAVGKWGIAGGGESGMQVTSHPLDKGFDYYYGFLDHMAGHTYYHYDGYVRRAYMGITENRTNATESAKGVYSTDLFIAKTKQLITEHMAKEPEKPFFLFLAVNTVHGSGFCDDSVECKKPLHIPGRPYPKEGVSWPLAKEQKSLRNTWINPIYKGLPDNAARYATAITRLDDGVGDLLAHLAKHGIDRDTMIIFTSDNGPADEYGADPRFFNSNGPFDGLKRDVFEGGLRVPTFVSWPAKLSANQIDDKPSQFHDWMATLSHIGSGVQNFSQHFSGVSLLPRWGTVPNVATYGDFASSQIFSRYNFPWGGSTAAFKEFKARKGNVRGEQQMVRDGDYVAIRTRINDTKDNKANTPIRLYNVVKDPYQANDLAGDVKYKEILLKFKSILDAKL